MFGVFEGVEEKRLETPSVHVPHGTIKIFGNMDLAHDPLPQWTLEVCQCRKKIQASWRRGPYVCPCLPEREVKRYRTDHNQFKMCA